MVVANWILSCLYYQMTQCGLSDLELIQEPVEVKHTDCNKCQREIQQMKKLTFSTTKAKSSWVTIMVSLTGIVWAYCAAMDSRDSSTLLASYTRTNNQTSNRVVHIIDTSTLLLWGVAANNNNKYSKHTRDSNICEMIINCLPYICLSLRRVCSLSFQLVDFAST